MTRWPMVTAMALALLGGGAAAQEREQPSPYFECPFINYFDSGCPQAEAEGEAAPPQSGDEREPPVGDGQAGENDRLQEVPEHLLPLFPAQSLAPDTPDLYRLLLTRPTIENARRYVRWHARHMRRLREVQELVAAAGAEFLAERSAGER